MTTEHSFDERRSEQCTTFLVAVITAKSEPGTTTDRVPAINHAGPLHALLPNTATWTAQSGCVTACAWPKSSLPNDLTGLRLTAGNPIRLRARTLGHFAHVDLDSSGRGFIRQDPFGLHPLYIATVRDCTYIANRPHLVASAIEHQTGNSVARDYRFASWLALSGYPIGDRTGYECVRCIPLRHNHTNYRRFRGQHAFQSTAVATHPICQRSYAHR